MTRSIALAIVATLAASSTGGCDFAVKHPAATAAIAGGALGFGTCGVEVGKAGTCAVIGGGAAAFLGLVAGIAMWTMGGDEEDHALYDPILPGDETVHGGATDGSPDGTQIDEPPPTNVNAVPTGPVVPKEKQTPIPRLPTTTPPPVEPTAPPTIQPPDPAPVDHTLPPSPPAPPSP